MEESQRAAHYNAWAKGKKWIKIEVKELEDGTFMATPIPQNVDDPACVVYRDTKQQVIYAIHSTLSSKGFEISNLAEVQGII